MENLTTISYDQARSLVQNGDIIFLAHNKSWVSEAIRFATDSIFSHVCIAFWITVAGRKRLMVVEAQGGNRRRILNLSAYRGVELHVVEPPLKWKSVAPTALEELGEMKYSMAQALYVGVRELLMTRFNIKIPEMVFTGEICSEFAARVYKQSDTAISPQLLYEELMKTCKERFVIK